MQRGLGEAYCQLREMPRHAARDAVRAYLDGDWFPRGWTRTGDAYTANLVQLVELPLEDLKTRALADGGDGVISEEDTQRHSIAMGTLAVLARRGNEDAHTWIRGQAGGGPAWFHAVESIYEHELPELDAAVGRRLMAQRSDAELKRLRRGGSALVPWYDWIADDVLPRENASPSADEDVAFRRPTADMTTAELLQGAVRPNLRRTTRILAERDTRAQRAKLLELVEQGGPNQLEVALRVFWEWRDPALWDSATAVLSDDADDRMLRTAMGYLCALPADRLLAQVEGWHAGSEPHRHLARLVLLDHATEAHVPHLREELELAMSAEEWWRASLAVEALATAGDDASLPAIQQYYEATTYQYGRYVAARAMLDLDPHIGVERGVAWLHDAENMMDLALDCIDPRDPLVRRDLERIVNDPTTHEELREEVQALLSSTA